MNVQENEWVRHTPQWLNPALFSQLEHNKLAFATKEDNRRTASANRDKIRRNCLKNSIQFHKLADNWLNKTKEYGSLSG